MLTSTRPYLGMAGAPGPVPFDSIDLYARRYGIAGDDFEDLLALIQAMDRAYLQHAKEEADRKKPS